LTLNSARPTPINLEFRSGYRLTGTLEVKYLGNQGVESVGVNADLSYDWLRRSPLQCFRGLMFLSPIKGQPPAPHPRVIDPPVPTKPSKPVEKPFPVYPPLPDSPMPVIAAEPGELFPYVHIRRWPRIADRDLQYGFIRYSAPATPASSFVADLAASSAQGRRAMEALAIEFLDGAAPYQGVFVAGPRDLSGPVSDFAAIAARLELSGPWTLDWADRLLGEVSAVLAAYGLNGAYFTDPAYLQALDRIWESYFALVVALGYDGAMLIDFALTLWLANAVQKALAVTATGDLEPAGLSVAESALTARATIVLPGDIFPLPAASDAPDTLGSPPRLGADGWVEPYAIGDLQMVRQRLVRYVPGEIAHIENVMRGERKEVSSRRGRRQLDVHQTGNDEEQVLTSDDADGRSSLLEETTKTVAGNTINHDYDNFSTTYGPPAQGTLNGSYAVTTTAVSPGQDELTSFAREILSKTVNRIARKVGTVRASSTLSQIEDAIVSVVDNTGGAANLRAVYRWVNKVYEARVVNYGSRLILEFVVRHPARRFLDRQEPGCDPRWAMPPSPASLNIDSFHDVTPLNYARLCAAYGVTDIQPPPPALHLATAALRGGAEAQIAIPAGFLARTVFAGCVTTPAGLAPPAIMVGCQIVTPGEAGVPLASQGEGLSLPVSVADATSSQSPPSNVEVQVNIEVECVPTPRLMDEWRIGIYASIVKAWREQGERHLNGLSDAAPRGLPRSPLANREIEKRELKAACCRLLRERAAAATGGGEPAPAGSPPSRQLTSQPGWLTSQPHCSQFLDTALEWPEMAYTFHLDSGREGDGGGAGHANGGDPLFSSFIEAGHARVLVPVRSERAAAFLYFLAAGMIWDGPDRLVAVNDADIPLVNDLKSAGAEGRQERRVGEPWEVLVPTAMRILDPLGAGTLDGGVSCEPGAGGRNA
jgi:hypothetical protein